MHAILTGLHIDNVKTDMQPYLLQHTTYIECGFAGESEYSMFKRNVTTRTEKVVCVSPMSDCRECCSPQRLFSAHWQKNLSKIKALLPAHRWPPDLLSEIRDMRSEMGLLKDLWAEVLQIKETMQKSTAMTGAYQQRTWGPLPSADLHASLIVPPWPICPTTTTLSAPMQFFRVTIQCLDWHQREVLHISPCSSAVLYAPPATKVLFLYSYKWWFLPALFQIWEQWQF